MRSFLFLLTLLSLFLLASPATPQTNLRPGIYSGYSHQLKKLPIDWGFSCSFPKDEKLRQQVRAGFDYWDSLTPRHFFRESTVCGQPTPLTGILVIPVRKQYLIDGEAVDGTAYFYPVTGQQTGGAIVLWEDWFQGRNPDTSRSVIRHEIGHILGFEHNEETERALMHPYINTERFRYHGHEKTLCNSELKEFRRLFGGKPGN